MQLYEGHGVLLLLRMMKRGLSLKLKIRQTIDEVDALEIIRKRVC
jgi:hypothetical protein